MLIPGKPVKHGACAAPAVSPQQPREVLRDMARKAEQEVMGVTMASMDELTLLSNRHGFTTLAQLGLDTCQRLEVPATLLFFDLDNFKQINYLYGRAEGDDALKSFADVLRIAFRESDVIGRLGDDEFVALLTGSSAVDLAAIKVRLEEILDERSAAMRRGYDIRFSIGQVEYDASRHGSIDELLDDAERALHR
ncbi:GGDEF domain-containing protein [Pseudomonas sp. 14P_8.1_Bac3]|uniref:GGDEF domain-containing protein n=1 Tax=Pseudomonas sp. 14P_8.1_Bac3 TaxID=2971621 RepID=UPI0021C9A0F9|nr:GGDEF domain-containing protein [Pseudomonas sp. 14P_8.1_Bac3]MCU1761528.1 GGDEF domain-containing protein [Pseudomonas sp. 14P_8.1_Bac3]